MDKRYVLQHGWFITRMRYLIPLTRVWRKVWLRLLGMQVGKGTSLPPMLITWPQQVQIGNNCKLEPNIYFKYAGIWEKDPSIIIGDEVFIGANCEFNISGCITIGDRAMIASGCKFIDHDHGSSLGSEMNFQKKIVGDICIEKGAWLGANVIVLKGVTIGVGAIAGAGSVVSKSIPAYEIWAGVPAKKISRRG